MLKLIRNINCLHIGRVAVNCRQISTHQTEYVPVYRFPYIKVFGLVNRLKVYQTLLTAAGIPATIALNQADVIGFETVLTTGALGVSGCVVFYSLGYLTDKFIGIVYLHKKEDTAKVSYLDFWGRRRDEIIPLTDIVPFSEAPIALTDGLFLHLRRFSTKNTLRINLRYGEVLHKAGFNKIFIKDI